MSDINPILVNFDTIAMEQIKSSEKSFRLIYTAMINGVVDKDLGYQLLSEIRENIKNAYQQRIELFRMMNINPKTLLEKQKITLNDFDTLVNGFLSKEVGPKL